MTISVHYTASILRAVRPETFRIAPRYPIMERHDIHQHPTVLIVEDEFLLRAALADYLQNDGFDVVEAGSADDAVEIISHADRPIDVVFSDVMMPGRLDGIGLAQWLRARHPEVQILLTSGRAESVSDAIRRCGRAMPKPYDMDQVAREIRKLV
jgi:DNA-binding response OmpR family regulator